MRYVRLVAIAAIIAGSISAQGLEGPKTPFRPTIISEALSWYSQWHMSDGTREPQSCSGRRLGNRIVLTCKPIDVIIIVDAAADRLCQVRFIRAGNGLPELSVSGSRKVPVNRNLDCDGFSNADGDFNTEVEHILGEVDLDLSKRAEKQASRYLQSWSKKCDASYPVVRRGDPFFHVYMVCGGVLDSVLEFRIVNGDPAGFSHWDYTRKGSNLPEGSDQRLNLARLWLESRSVGPRVSQ